MDAHQYLEEIPGEFSESSRVWIFQSSRPFTEQEELEINEQLTHFYLQWNSHGSEVKGWGKLFFKRFIIILADEQRSNLVSGCSTDSMIRVIKSLERQYKVNLFDRLTMIFLVGDKAEALPMQQLQYAADKGFIGAGTYFFDHSVAELKDLKERWIIPVRESWLNERINFATDQFSGN